jgi:hypothetical protein
LKKGRIGSSSNNNGSGLESQKSTDPTDPKHSYLPCQTHLFLLSGGVAEHGGRDLHIYFAVNGKCIIHVEKKRIIKFGTSFVDSVMNGSEDFGGTRIKDRYGDLLVNLFVSIPTDTAQRLPVYKKLDP